MVTGVLVEQCNSCNRLLFRSQFAVWCMYQNI